MTKPLSFSQRMGLQPVKVNIQTTDMDNDLRVALWNDICETILKDYSYGQSVYEESDEGMFLKKIWVDFYKSPIDEFSNSWHLWLTQLKKSFFNFKWNEVYDFLQFILDYWPNDWLLKERFIPTFNETLQSELSGYRIVEKILVPITSEQEKEEIETALRDSSKYKPIQHQLELALRKLADKENPDYRGSIKEFISAVETLCRIVTNQPKLELGKALKQIESMSDIDLHPALKDAFIKLYGWTSDESGIRHALMDESNLEFEDAKFMLVACSAFINYVLAKLAKTETED